jgi:glycerophosphoryl diester phosphodiesterase
MRINKDCWLTTIPIAHRGLFSGTAVENSISAYKEAIKNEFAIEIDVYLTKDLRLVCFHDENLLRATGEDAFIYDKTLDELKKLNLFNTEEKIPTLDEVLALCENKTPLLIEIKNQPNKMVVDMLIERLKGYGGEFAIQSFNPLYLIQAKKLAPEFLRGVLGTAEKGEVKNPIKRWIVREMPLNPLAKPDFISYDFNAIPLKKSRRKNLPLLAWTVRDLDTEIKVRPFIDNIIFENYIPKK